jgi:hypothetical protein
MAFLKPCEVNHKYAEYKSENGINQVKKGRFFFTKQDSVFTFLN